MSIQDYLTYRRLEKEFDLGTFSQNYTGDSELYITGIREGKRNALKRILKKSLVTLITIGALAGTGLYLHNSEPEYQRIVSEAAAKSDLNGDGETSGSREIAEFYSNFPSLVNWIRL